MDDEEENLGSDGGGETWLTSYADLMTLIACFFILIVAFANYEDPAFQEKAQEFSQYFNKSKPIKIEKASEKNIEKKIPKKIPSNQDKILSSPTDPKNLSEVNIIPKKGKYEIEYTASAIFPPGKTVLTQKVKDSVDVLVNLIQEKKEDFYIIVEGHTDDTDISSIQYPSNWELSAARASKIIKLFEKNGFQSEKLVAVAYGNSNPLYPNRDKEGQAIKKNQRLNRRVVIKVLKFSEIKDKIIGPNILFKGE